MTCEAIFVEQLDGSTYQGVNCGPASGSMLVRHATCNVKAPTAAQFRTHVRNPDGSQDRNATGLAQIRIVCENTYKVGTTDAYGFSFPQLQTASAGKGFILAVDYSPIAGTKYDCFRRSFFGDHFIWIERRLANGYWRGADPGADGRYVGCPKGYQSYPDSLLRTAAGMHKIFYYSGGSWHTTTVAARYGAGHAFALIGSPSPQTVPPAPELPGEPETMHYLKAQVMTMAANTQLYQRADLAAPVLETVGPSFKVTTIGRPYKGNVVDTSWWEIRWTTNKPDNSAIATERGVYVRSDRLT